MTRPHGLARLGLTSLALLLASCFGNPDTLGLPCTEDSACFDGLMCGASGVCVEPSKDSGDGDSGDGDSGDGDTGDGDSGDGDTGDGDTGDGDTGDGDRGDGDGESGDGESGDGDGESGEPVCGDGIREGAENCDGMDLDGLTCANQGYGGGMLACNDICELVFTDCCLGEGQDCEFLANSCCGNMQCMLITFVCK